MRLFVYGSLKKGFFNHNRFGFGDAAKFLGSAVARDVSLVRLGNLPYPHAFKSEGGEVVGEVYELEDTRIADALDQMERGAGYEPLLVQIDEEGEEAMMYVADDWTYNNRIKPAVGGTIMREWKED
jgi:gamma-glutamylcyclotransferase (GGCT)/AIG2-like uncharacterized protein YtfP